MHMPPERDLFIELINRVHIHLSRREKSILFNSIKQLALVFYFLKSRVYSFLYTTGSLVIALSLKKNLSKSPLAYQHTALPQTVLI